MSKYLLPYFGEMDLTSLDEYYDVDIDFNGNNVGIDLNFEGKSITQNKLDTVKDFLDGIGKFDERNKLYIDDDFKREGEALDYINFYFDEFDEDELSEIIGDDDAINPEGKHLVNKLKLIRVGLYPDHNSECFGVFDYSIDIDGEPCNQLLVVKTDEKGNLDHITWES